MATKNVVPRADSEGGIGTALKRWLNGFFRHLTVSDDATVGGAITAGSATVNGALAAGSLTADSATIDGTLTVGDTTVDGELTASSATVSGTLNVGSATISGALTADSLNVDSVAIDGANAFTTDVVTYNAADVIDISGSSDVTSVSGIINVIGGRLVYWNVLYNVNLNVNYQSVNYGYNGGVVTNTTICPNKSGQADEMYVLPGGWGYTSLALFFNRTDHMEIRVSKPGFSGIGYPVRFTGMYWI